jgi:hypothetical protein
MPLCKSTAGAGFEVFLEGSGFVAGAEGDGGFDMPGPELCCVFTAAGVVIFQPGFEICRESSVMARGNSRISKDIYVMAGIAAHVRPPCLMGASGTLN